MRTELARLHERLDTTTIYVTHDQTEAMTLATRLVVMNEGIIQQVGTPANVYDYPENVFVASFLGSPAMNFMKVTYENGYITNGNSLNMKINEPHRKLLEKSKYNGKEVILGIRPEDIHSEVIALETNKEAKLRLTVDVSELTAAETIIYTKVDGPELIARLDKRAQFQHGEEIEVAFDMSKVHFFDLETEEVIK